LILAKSGCAWAKLLFSVTVKNHEGAKSDLLIEFFLMGVLIILVHVRLLLEVASGQAFVLLFFIYPIFHMLLVAFKQLEIFLVFVLRKSRSHGH
jgi:hypothetical protein